MPRIFGATIGGLLVGAAIGIGVYIIWFRDIPIKTEDRGIEAQTGVVVMTDRFEVSFFDEKVADVIRQAGQNPGLLSWLTAFHVTGIGNATADVWLDLKTQPLFLYYTRRKDDSFDLRIEAPLPVYKTTTVAMDTPWVGWDDRSWIDSLGHRSDAVKAAAKRVLENKKTKILNDRATKNEALMKEHAKRAINELVFQFTSPLGIKIHTPNIEFKTLSEPDIADRRKKLPISSSPPRGA